MYVYQCDDKVILGGLKNLITINFNINSYAIYFTFSNGLLGAAYSHVNCNIEILYVNLIAG